MGNESVKLSKDEKQRFLQGYGIPQEKFEVVIKSFKKHATSDGKIGREEFKKILTGVMHEDLADQVFDSFDRDKNNLMDVREYLAMMGVTHGGTVEQKLKASFELFDKNGDGELSKDEVRAMFVLIVKQKRTAQQFQKTGQRVSSSSIPIDDKGMAAIEGVIGTVFDRIDTDKSGTISLGEFMNGFSQHPDVCGFFKQF